jgi:TP901 family phage tail tape measure protein
MAKIRANELFEKEDIFEGIRQSAEKTMVTLDKIDAEFKKIGATLKKDISQAKFGGARELKEFMQMVEKANNLQRDTIKLEKEKAIAEQQSEKLKQQKIRTQEAENRQQERINKQKQRQQKLLKDEADAYKRLVKSTRELKNESKRLGAELLNLEMSGKKNTEQYRKLEKQYNRVTKSAQKGDAQLKKLDKRVGDNFRNVGNYVGALNTLKTGLAQLGLAFGIGTLVRGGVESIIDFDQAVADLSAITGATGEDLKFFKEQARELGIEVDGGASAVVEAYKLIGSAKPELLENAQALNEVTKSAILLSQASGLELPEASKNLTSALNQFKAPAEEAGRFINVLANGAKFGSAEIPEITNALLKFGGVADGFNVSIEESVAMIELLRPSFKESAEVGTALRNIMLKMSAPEGTPKLAKEFAKAGINVEKLSDQSLTFEERVRELLPLLEDENALVKVFGAENIVGAKAMLTQVEAMDEMTEKMHTMGTIQEQANTRTQTLGHALMELKNAFTDLFLGITESENSMQGLVKFLQWITANLPTIVTIIGKLIRAFVIYKTTMLALKGINFIVSGGFRDLGKEIAKQIPLTKAYTREQKRLAKAQGNSVKVTNTFASSLASLGIGLAIGLITELALKWYDLASQTAEARRQQDLYNEAQQQGQKRADEITGKFEKQLDEQLRLLDIETRKTLALEKNEKKRQQIREDALKQMDELTLKTKQQVQDAINESVKLAQHQHKIGKILVADAKSKQTSLNKAMGSTHLKNVSNEVNKVIIAQNKVTTELQKQRENLSKQSDEYKTRLVEETEANKDYNVTLHKSKSANDDASDSQRTFKTELKDTNVYLSRQIDLLQELTEIEQERQLISAQKDIDAEFERQLKLLEETGKFEADALNEMIRKKTEMEKGFIDQRVQYEMDAVDRKIKLQEQKENDALIKQRDQLLAQADITQEAIDKINADYDIKEKELQAQQLKRQKDAETEKIIIHEQGINDKKELDDEYLESIDKYNDKLVEKQKEANRVIFESTDAIVKASADYFIQQSQRKIEQLEKEISMAEKQADTLRALAEQGNIDAQESLAEQQKIIAEANRKKLEEQKRQQRIQLAQSVYSTYTAKVNANSKNPLAETIRDTQVLNQFIQSLPTFFDGTEDTGTNGRGIDGKGGFLSVLHPNERVVPKSLNDQIGSMSNDELSQLAMEYQNGKMVRSDSQISSALELAVLVNRLDNLTKVIQDKPETNIELGEITQGAMEIVKSTKKGNTIVYNRYKIK